MITLNWTGIVVLSIAGFAGGAIWFGPFFGKLWMKIHGFENVSREEMDRRSKGMWKQLIAEFISVFFMIMTLDFMIKIIPGYSGLHIGFMVWLGYVLPTYITATIWGGDERKWMFAKITLPAIYRFIMLLGAGYVLGTW